MDYRFHTADVFTDRIFGGNPLAVFPEAAGLTTARMQAIAREFNLSETAFVLPAEDPAHAACLRIFTPYTELPFAGHPTVGTAHVLASLGHIRLTGETTQIVFEEGVGPVPVTIRAEDGRPVFCQLTAAQAPTFGPEPPPAAELAAMLSLEAADILTTARDRPRAVSCGVPFLFLPLSNRQALAPKASKPKPAPKKDPPKVDRPAPRNVAAKGANSAGALPKDANLDQIIEHALDGAGMH